MGVKYVKDFDFPSSAGFHGSNKMPARAGVNAPARGAPRMEAPPRVGKAQGYAKGGPVRLRGGGTPAPGSRAFMRDVPGRGDYKQVTNPLGYLGIGSKVVNVPKGYAQQKERIAAVKKSMPFEPGAKVTPGVKSVQQAIREFPNAKYDPAYDPRYAEQAKKAQAAKNAARKKPTVTVEQVPDKGAPSRGGGSGISSGGAMARGMPMSGLPDTRRGSVTVEETEEQGYRRGGSVKSRKIGKVMREYKEGKLHSGSKKGPMVKNPKQAMAIALSEAGRMKKAKGGSVSKGPSTRGTARKGREQGRQDRMERWAEQRMKHAEKYAPGLSLDMSEYAKGGKVKHSDVQMDKSMMKKAVHKHERSMHPGKPLTKLRRGGVPSYGRKAMYGGGKC